MNKKIMPILKNISKENTSISLNDFRVIYALERAVARLEQNAKLSKHLIFKGGFVLLKLTETNRFTRDADAIAYDISKETVENLIKEAMLIDLKDGIYFGDLSISSLPDQGEYGGIRFYFRFQIDGQNFPQTKIHKLSRIHLDIGFGDYVPDKITNTHFFSVIQFNEPVSWKIFPLEYIFAEKLQTFIQRGEGNSRSKDIFDIIFLYNKIEEKEKLVDIMKIVFTKRNTEIPESFLKFANEMDTLFLENSWGSIDIRDIQISFDEAWRSLKEILKFIDLNK